MHLSRILFLIGKKPFWLHLPLTGLWIGLVILVGWSDYEYPSVSLFVFYALITILSSLFLSTVDGIACAVLSAFLHYLSCEKYLTYDSHTMLYINLAMDIIVFFVIVTLVVQLRNSLQRERKLSRMDYLTGAVNKQYFTELLDNEIHRVMRNKQAFSLAYIDMDNFKNVNDSLGHSEGDIVLKFAVKIMRENIRNNDWTGRLGGDEFIILLPETGAEEAKAVLDRVSDSFLNLMKEHNYPVTLSVGIATFLKPPSTVDEALKRADETMYQAKKSGKNRIEVRICQ